MTQNFSTYCLCFQLSISQKGILKLSQMVSLVRHSVVIGGCNDIKQKAASGRNSKSFIWD